MGLVKQLQIVTLSVGISLSGGALSAAYACADGSCEPPGETTKGNNGWGQEKNKGTTDGTNNGSDDGKTAGTKTPSTER